ncbi:wax ester/triacylglycerol synthase domain-containing protein, partial [Mycolicibacterium elephantis]
SLEIAVSGALRFATRPLKLVNALPTTVTSVVDTVRRARTGLTMATPFSAPQTVFNANVTAHRNVAFTELDLEDIKTVKNRFGVKVNDVVMALVSGVLRKFLDDRGALP